MTVNIPADFCQKRQIKFILVSLIIYECQQICQSSNFASPIEFSMIVPKRNAKCPPQNSSRLKLGCQMKSKGFFFFFLSSKLTVTLRCCKTEVKKNKEAVQKAKLPIARYINMVSFCWELWQGIQPNTALTRKDSTDFNSPRGETLAEHLSNLEYITPWNKIHIRQCEESLPYTKHKTLHFKTYVFT